VLPYGRQSIDEDDIGAVLDVLRGDWLTTGPAVQTFEADLSQLTGGHRAVSCSSGTAALHVAYSALELGPGDEVVTTPLTFVATASAASLVGATVVFADVDPDTGLLDPASAAAAVTARTRVVAGVDYAGHPCDYDRLREVAASTGAILLADAAHSIGGSAHGRPVGDLADVTTFSFFPTKNLTTAEGGAVTARDGELAQRLAELRNVGLVRDPDRFRVTSEGPWHQEVHRLGLNYRLTDLAAALGSSQLRRLPSFVDRRREIFERYSENLKGIDALQLPVTLDGYDPAWHLYAVRIKDGRRRAVYDGLREAGIGVQVNYVPVYWHPVYADLGYQRGLCPVAEQFYEEELSLPMYPGLTDSQVDHVSDLVQEVLR
jgi:UDP-4-amino-4,6-dideoxy-N-acetyl-beta-L-altrosamine transaminase